ncbi:hypothetical protein [Anaerobacillus sp. 1_MG-2023]|uniref:hypothetical protein n=1 Tax=Anaerobacillus sp. 1_MG-2023 TaxID=3062655 RepID=UPI0026E369CE|nr:hypothetical protein [Anaerobacillus sp. 1_MG-2023]MDO6657494.1 hypothetical protein [Anaerobacillus sp. 1_MG-2023]
MQTNNIPFNFYDHVACIFPGSIFLSYILYIMDRFFYPNISNYLIELNAFSSLLFILILVIASFTCGHIAYSVSKWSFELKPIISSSKPVDKFLDYSPHKQTEIIEEVSNIYGISTGDYLHSKLIEYKNGEISGATFGLKNYCYALVERKEAKHDMFIAIADFLRSTSFLMILGFVYLEFITIWDLVFKNDILDLFKCIALIIFILIPSLTLFNRSIRLRKAADSVIYSQFLYDAKKVSD